MFHLFSRLENGLNPMATIVEQFIPLRGNEIINQRKARLDCGEKDKNDDPTFMKALLDLLGVIKSDFPGHSPPMMTPFHKLAIMGNGAYEIEDIRWSIRFIRDKFDPFKRRLKTVQSNSTNTVRRVSTEASGSLNFTFLTGAFPRRRRFSFYSHLLIRRNVRQRLIVARKL